MNVTLVDSLDEHEQEVFHPFPPAYMVDKRLTEKTSWYKSFNYFPIKTVSCVKGQFPDLTINWLLFLLANALYQEVDRYKATFASLVMHGT